MGDFNNLIQTLQKYIDPAQTFANILIALVAAIIIGLTLISAMNKFRKKNWAEGGAFTGAAIMIALLAFMGVVGVGKIADSIKPDFATGNDQFSSAPAIQSPYGGSVNAGLDQGAVLG